VEVIYASELTKPRYLLLSSAGDIPFIDLNTLLKWVIVLNPHLNLTSETKSKSLLV